MEAELARLLALVEAAASLVQKELLRAVSRDAKVTARIKRERLARISAILKKLRAEAVGREAEKRPGAAWDLVRAGYREGTNRAHGELRRLGRDPVGQELSGIHLEAARALYDSLVDSLDDAITHVGRRANDVLRKVVIREALVGELAGRDRNDTASAVEDNLRSRGVEGFVDSAGRAWTLPRYAKMAAATTAHEASTTAALNRFAENGIDLVRWVARAEMGTNSPCDRCKRLDGKVYSITGTTPGYPRLEEAPPLHPYCVCVLVAHIPSLSETPAGGAAGAGDPGEGDADRVPGEPTPAARRAVRAVEDEIRTRRNEEAHAYTPTGEEVFVQAGGASSVSFTEEQVRMMKGNILTHNHPHGLRYPEGHPLRVGNSFSLADIDMAARAEMLEVRAVTPVHRYSMRPPEGGWDPAFALYRIRPVFARVDQEVRSAKWRAIMDGELTPEEAGATHFHDVWTRVAEELGMRYEREES